MSKPIDAFQNTYSDEERAWIYYAISGAILSPSYGSGGATDVRHLAPLIRWGFQHDDGARRFVAMNQDKFTNADGVTWSFDRHKYLKAATEYNNSIDPNGGGREVMANKIAYRKVGPVPADGNEISFWQQKYDLAYQEAFDSLPVGGQQAASGGNISMPIPVDQIQRDTSTYLPFEEQLGWDPSGLIIAMALVSTGIGMAGGATLFFKGMGAGLAAGHALIPGAILTGAGYISTGIAGTAAVNMIAGLAIAGLDPEGQGELNKEALTEAELQLQRNALGQELAKNHKALTGEDKAYTDDEINGILDSVSNGSYVQELSNTYAETAINAQAYPASVSTPSGNIARSEDYALRHSGLPGQAAQDMAAQGGAYFTTAEEALEWVAINNSEGFTAFQWQVENNPALALEQANAMYFEVMNPRVAWVGEGRAGSPINPDQTGYTSSDWQYTYEDFSRITDSMTPGQLQSFTDRAVLAGLLPDTYHSTGYLDESLTGAMETLLYSSNLSGNQWDTQLNVLGDAWQEIVKEEKAKSGAEKRKAAGYAIEDFVPSSAYVRLDTAYLNQVSKNAVRRALRRDPNQWEIDLMNQEQRSVHSAAYSSDVANQRSVFEARGRAIEFDEPQDDTLGSVQGVDEESRFNESFEKRYEVEIDEEERSGRIREDSANLFGGLRSLSNQMGGV